MKVLLFIVAAFSSFSFANIVPSVPVAPVTERPLRALGIGSKFVFHYNAVPALYESQSYQNGKLSYTELHDWDGKTPFCKVQNSGFTPGNWLLEPQILEAVTIDGQYWDGGMEGVVNFSFFATDIFLKKDESNFLSVTCYSTSAEDMYGEIRIGEFEAVFGGEVTFDKISVENSGYENAPILSPDTVLNPKVLRQMEVVFLNEVVLWKQGSSMYSSIFQDGKITKEMEFDIRKPYCQLFVFADEKTQSSEYIRIPRDFRSKFGKLDANYSVADNTITYRIAGFDFGGVLKDFQGHQLRMMCLMPKAATSPLFVETTPITAGFIDWIHNLN